MFYRARVKWVITQQPSGSPQAFRDCYPIMRSGIWSTVYAKVRADSELGPIFKRAIPGDWGPHLATMHDFWSSIMLTSGRYKGNPVAVHLGWKEWSRNFSDAG
jgi:hypothetical protein